MNEDEEWGDLKVANTLDAEGEFLTPRDLLETFNDEFNFDFDPCPYPRPKWDGLRTNWGERNYVNPPFKGITKWVHKAIEENKKGKLVCFILPVQRMLLDIISEVRAYELRPLPKTKWMSPTNPRKKATFPAVAVIMKIPQETE